jgi:hypothetical protein
MPNYKQLACYLGVSEQAVKQYDPVKRELMLLGLKVKSEENKMIISLKPAPTKLDLQMFGQIPVGYDYVGTIQPFKGHLLVGKNTGVYVMMCRSVTSLDQREIKMAIDNAHS